MTRRSAPFVIGPSVLMHLYHRSNRTPRVLELLADPDRRLMMPDCAVPTLVDLLRSTHHPTPDARRIHTILHNLLHDRPFEIVPTINYVERAFGFLELADADELTTNDAVYLAVAEEAKGTLITVNRPFYDRVSSVPSVAELVMVVTPDDQTEPHSAPLSSLSPPPARVQTPSQKE